MSDGGLAADVVKESTAKTLETEALAKQGMRLFPLVPYGKKPCLGSWPELATADLGQIRRWQDEFRGCNWGLATGAVSGVFAIDLDGEQGLASAGAWTREHGSDWKNTRIARTARGYHLYYRWPVGLEIRNSASDLAPGVDVRGEGGYVVVAPSLVRPPAAIKDHQYQWLDDSLAIASAPEWLLNKLQSVEESRGTRERHLSCASMSGGVIPEGQRNQFLASLAGSMRRRNMSQDAITAALKAENTNRCSPPLDESEVESIAASIARYEPGRPAVLNNGEWPEPQSLGSELLPVAPLSLSPQACAQ